LIVEQATRLAVAFACEAAQESELSAALHEDSIVVRGLRLHDDRSDPEGQP
jgi:hypothetical protein